MGLNSAFKGLRHILRSRCQQEEQSATPLAVNRRLHIATVRVGFPGSSCGICGGKIAMRQVLSTVHIWILVSFYGHHTIRYLVTTFRKKPLLAATPYDSRYPPVQTVSFIS